MSSWGTLSANPQTDLWMIIFGLKYFLGMFSSLLLSFFCANERCSSLNMLLNKIFENEQIWGVLVFRN